MGGFCFCSVFRRLGVSEPRKNKNFYKNNTNRPISRKYLNIKYITSHNGGFSICFRL